MKILCLNFYHFLKEKTLLLFLFLSFATVAQQGLSLPIGVSSDKIKFILANNLIVIPVELNGVPLSFILDTGVGSTILFGVDQKEVLELKNASTIYLKGLGNDEPAEAIKSTNNILEIGDAYSGDHTVYMIFDESINFSPQMGFPIHGIIGYDFFKKFILDINYSRKTIKISDPALYTYKKCKKCFKTDLDFSNGRKRPLVKARYKTNNGYIDINLLLDSGSGSALWLFENKDLGISASNESFDDFLGKGFNGNIYGKKGKIAGFSIGDFELNKVTAAFPDSIYIGEISTKSRQGSIGGSILRRFNLIVDYPNSKISFKKNNFFSKPFFYNMSGLTIQHSGIRVIRDYSIKKGASRPSLGFLSKENGKITRSILEADVASFNFDVQPEYEISDVRPNSPAALAGLQKGDKVLEVNGRKSYLYKLSDINDLFHSEEGKRITIKIERLGIEMKITFHLKKVI